MDENTREHIQNVLQWGQIDREMITADGAVLFGSGFAAKVYFKNIPRAKNASSALKLLNGVNAPRFVQYIRADDFAVVVSEEIAEIAAQKATSSDVAKALRHIHDQEQDLDVKYSSDPLDLRTRLMKQLPQPFDALSQKVFARIEGSIDQVDFDNRCLIHRDAVERNILPTHDGVCFVDWDHAAYGPPAWDFAKLGEWLELDKQFHAEYGALPEIHDIEWFGLYDAFSEWARWPDDLLLLQRVEYFWEQYGSSKLRNMIG